MNTDIRLSVGFASHPKTVKLIRRLGPEGVFSLLALWTWAAQNRNSGVLSGMDEEDVAIAAAWGGEPGALVDTLLALRFLDRRGQDLELHEWAEHQAYVVQEPLRRARAQKAALARWGALSVAAAPSAPDSPDAEEEADGAPAPACSTRPLGGAGGVPSCPDHASGMPAACSSNAPIPTDPSTLNPLASLEGLSAPSGPDTPRDPFADAEHGCPAGTAQGPAAPPCPYAGIVALYHEVLPEHRRVAVLGGKRHSAVKARWADVGKRLRDKGGPDGRAERLDWLRRFFEEAAASDFLTGRQPGRDGRTYLVDFDKLMSPGGFAGVIEGKYRNREAV